MFAKSKFALVLGDSAPIMVRVDQHCRLRRVATKSSIHRPSKATVFISILAFRASPCFLDCSLLLLASHVEANSARCVSAGLLTRLLASIPCSIRARKLSFTLSTPTLSISALYRNAFQITWAEDLDWMVSFAIYVTSFKRSMYY